MLFSKLGSIELQDLTLAPDPDDWGEEAIRLRILKWDDPRFHWMRGCTARLYCHPSTYFVMLALEYSDDPEDRECCSGSCTPAECGALQEIYKGGSIMQFNARTKQPPVQECRQVCLNALRSRITCGDPELFFDRQERNLYGSVWNLDDQFFWVQYNAQDETVMMTRYVQADFV